jgi:uncharacterized protein (TIGR02246 family)
MTINHPSEIHERFEAAVNSKDVDAMMALYDVDGVAIELDGSECTGEAAFRAMLTGLAGALSDLEGTTTKVIVAGDIALTAGTWTAQVPGPDGGLVTASGTNVEVSRRQADGTWLLVIDDPAFF